MPPFISGTTFVVVCRFLKGTEWRFRKIMQHASQFAQLSFVIFDHFLKHLCQVLKSTSDV